jgi:ABC-type antimicrobial peptide transport system permease subunit
MISLKLAVRSVFRRPSQNMAVVMGIALGVSLFLGVQIGGDSLASGLIMFSEESLGEIDAQVRANPTQFFTTESILEKELSGNFTTDVSLLSQLSAGGQYLEYIDSMAERLQLRGTVLQPEIGTIQISTPMNGLSPDESGFGDLVNSEGSNLRISVLNNTEVYIGEDLARNLFSDEDPIGRTLTYQSTIFSFPIPMLNISSVPIPIQLNLTIVDVFEYESKGMEHFSNNIVISLDHLQKYVHQTFLMANLQSPEIILGYGEKPISNIIIKWKDSVIIGEDSTLALELLTERIEYLFGEFSAFYSVEDTRWNIKISLDESVEALKDILNIFGSLIIFAGILVIINIQNMTLAARSKETGILRALGSSKKQIIIRNLSESMFLGIIGSIIGLAGGILYGRLLILFLGIAFGFPTGNFPLAVSMDTIVTSFLAGFVISQVTGIFPALSASKINIAQVLQDVKVISQERFGKKSFYLGSFLSFFALLMVFNLDPNPLVDGKNAFKNLDDIEGFYLPIASLIIGPALLVAYYKSKKLGLTIVGTFLLGWAYFNVFIVFDWIVEGMGGLFYILYIIMSLIFGSVVLIAVNLGTISTIAQNIVIKLTKTKKTSVRGTTLVALRKMKSNVTRSTLTFTLFATILTMNIFIATWSYSFRYGFDTQVEELTGNVDILVYSSDNAVPKSIDLPTRLIEEFSDNKYSTSITYAAGFTITSGNPSFIHSLDEQNLRSTKLVSVGENIFWDETDEWVFKFPLLADKSGTPYDTNETVSLGESSVSELDEEIWRTLSNNGTIPNKDGLGKPMIITSFMNAVIDDVPQLLFNPGYSVWLNTTAGELQEFVVAGITPGNPIVDFQTPTTGAPIFESIVFVSDFWKSKLLGFQGFGDVDNIFTIKTSEIDKKSEKLPELVFEIERWANQVDGEFRQKYGLYGLLGVTSYSIYEAFLEGNYRFFGFLQAFVSLGFVVGVLGLLVVASRSVTERTREIGMLRALGFKQNDVVISVVLELIIMGMIGLFIGIINGTIMGYALTDINSGGTATFLIPWTLILFYGLLTLFLAIISAIFPAIKASRIPASDALRYTG